MEKVCLLNLDLNKCEHKGNDRTCNAPHSFCGMMVKLDVAPKKEYVRQPRWYEKYYNK